MLATATLTLPPALDLPAIERLERELAAIEADAQVRAIRIEGQGGVFCRGMDLEALAHAASPQAGVERYAGLLQRLRHGARPVIAAVDGDAIAGGIGFLAVADLVIATERSTFALPEILFGLLPAIVLAGLRERVPVQKARLWTLSAGTLTVHEAHRIGLVDEVVADAEALARSTRSWARRFARAALAAVAVLRARHEPFDYPAAVAHTSGTVTDPSIRSAIDRFLRDGETPW